MTKIDGLGKLLIGVDTKGYLTTVESSVAAQLVLRLMEMVESSGGVCLRTLFCIRSDRDFSTKCRYLQTSNMEAVADVGVFSDTRSGTVITILNSCS